MLERVLAKFQFAKVNTYASSTSVKYFVWVTSGKCFWTTETSNLNLFSPFLFRATKNNTRLLADFKLTLWLRYGGPFRRIELRKMSHRSHSLVIYLGGFKIWDIPPKLPFNESYWKGPAMTHHDVEEIVGEICLDQELGLRNECWKLVLSGWKMTSANFIKSRK